MIVLTPILWPRTDSALENRALAGATLDFFPACLHDVVTWIEPLVLASDAQMLNPQLGKRLSVAILAIVFLCPSQIEGVAKGGDWC